MKYINRIKDFVPGISSIYALPIYNIAGIDGDKISVKDEEMFFKFYFANDSEIASYKPVVSDRGDLYEISIQGFLPGESIINNKQLNLIRKYRYLVIYMESDGSYRLVGNAHTGLKMNLEYLSSPAKGYRIEFFGQLLSHPKPSQPYILKNGTIIGFDQPSAAQTD